MTRLLRHVAAPMIVFDLIDPPQWPEIWPEGRHHVGMRFFGLLPIGRQWIVTSVQPPRDEEGEVYRLRDAGEGDIAKVWDHHIEVRARPDGRCDYADRVEVKAGVLTPFVWAFAHVFYRHRQARWRRLIAANFAYK